MLPLKRNPFQIAATIREQVNTAVCSFVRITPAEIAEHAGIDINEMLQGWTAIEQALDEMGVAVFPAPMEVDSCDDVRIIASGPLMDLLDAFLFPSEATDSQLEGRGCLPNRPRP
jgi:hypothetical protein